MSAESRVRNRVSAKCRVRKRMSAESRVRNRVSAKCRVR